MNKMIAFDCETGGLDPKKNPILTAYFVIVGEDFSLIDDLDIKIRVSEPYSTVELTALKVNGIDLDKHNSDPETLDRPEAVRKISEFVSKHKGKGRYDKPVSLGHNVDFDLRMIYEQIMSVDEWEKCVGYAIRDTKKVSDFLKDFGLIPPEIGSLVSLSKYLNVPHVGAHTAKDDVLVTIQCYKKLGEIVKSPGASGLSLDMLDILEK